MRQRTVVVREAKHVTTGGEFSQPSPLGRRVGERARQHTSGTRGNEHTGSAGRGVQFWHVDHERHESDPSTFGGERRGNNQPSASKVNRVAEAHVDAEVRELSSERDNQLVHTTANSGNGRSGRYLGPQRAHCRSERAFARQCAAKSGYRGVNGQIVGIERVHTVYDRRYQSLKRPAAHSFAHERTDGGINRERLRGQHCVDCCPQRATKPEHRPHVRCKRVPRNAEHSCRGQGASAAGRRQQPGTTCRWCLCL